MTTRKTGKTNTTGKTSEIPAMMDSTAPEKAVGVASTNNTRVCWALKTLVKEVHDLFPETPVEYSGHDGRNTALDVTFDCSMVSIEDQIVFVDLLNALLTDVRVASVDVAEDQAFVSMKSSPRTQDIRDSFGLADAYSVLTGEDDDVDPTAITWDPTPGNPFNGLPEVTAVRGGLRMWGSYDGGSL